MLAQQLGACVPYQSDSSALLMGTAGGSSDGSSASVPATRMGDPEGAPSIGCGPVLGIVDVWRVAQQMGALWLHVLCGEGRPASLPSPGSGHGAAHLKQGHHRGLENTSDSQPHSCRPVIRPIL